MELPDYIKNRYWKDYLPEGVSLDIDIPEDMTLGDLFLKSTEDHCDKINIVYGDTEYTFKAMQELTTRFANALLSLGAKKGDIVALWLTNCPQFIISYFATLIIGGSVTAISPLYVAREAAYQIKDSGAKFLILNDNFLPHYNKFETGLPLEKVIPVNVEGGIPSEPETDRIIHFNTLMNQNIEPAPLPDVKIDPRKDIAVYQYTGGTTGLPKGALLSHYNIMANCLQLKQITDKVKDKYLKEDIAAISVLPWYHIFGQVVEMVSSYFTGSKEFVLPAFDIEKILEIIKKFRPNTLYGVPTMYISLLNSLLSKNVDISCIKSTHLGASPMPIEVAKEWKRRTGLAITEGYGLTEASPAVANSPSWSKKKPGSCGHPLTNTLVGIINEKLEFLPIGRAGELVISGPQVMIGYHNRPEENSKVFFETGGHKWLRTGDIAKFDEEGYIYILDRVKDMIKYKGHSVYPREIEEVLYEHPAVLECGIIGIKDPVKGENIKACITLREQYKNKITEQEIIDWTKGNIAAYKYPRIVEFFDDLPKSPVGKILKRSLRKREERQKRDS
ncbi:MAG: AMP-binding protein [Candidatus Hermodarchaeota archaeon]